MWSYSFCPNCVLCPHGQFVVVCEGPGLRGVRGPETQRGNGRFGEPVDDPFWHGRSPPPPPPPTPSKRSHPLLTARRHPPTMKKTLDIKRANNRLSFSPVILNSRENIRILGSVS